MEQRLNNASHEGFKYGARKGGVCVTHGIRRNDVASFLPFHPFKSVTL
jgi:hypothetical protein